MTKKANLLIRALIPLALVAWVLLAPALYIWAFLGASFPSNQPADWGSAGDWLSGASTLSIGVIGTYFIWKTITQNSAVILGVETSLKMLEEAQVRMEIQLSAVANFQKDVAEKFTLASNSMGSAIGSMERVANQLSAQLQAAEKESQANRIRGALSELDKTLDRLLDTEVPHEGRYGGSLQMVKKSRVGKLIEIWNEESVSRPFLADLKKFHAELVGAIQSTLERRNACGLKLREISPDEGDAVIYARSRENAVPWL